MSYHNKEAWTSWTVVQGFQSQEAEAASAPKAWAQNHDGRFHCKLQAAQIQEGQ